MRVFECPACGDPIYFDNLECVACDLPVAFDPHQDEFTQAESRSLCASRSTVESCNWIAEDGPWCQGCAMDLDHAPDDRRLPFQQAKRRTLRQLLRWHVRPGRLEPALRFDMRASTPEAPVSTGHADGTITFDTAEADPVTRERIRTDLGEPYRTPVGHVRHELGHWWWAVTFGHGDEQALTEFRKRFGDERRDYEASLEAHYSQPDDGSWRKTHVSHYASSHPWEDFAESFAHVLHIVDSFETAVCFGFATASALNDTGALLRRWPNLAIALNELSRSMGIVEPYPFVLAPPAIEKIRYVAEQLSHYGAHAHGPGAPRSHPR